MKFEELFYIAFYLIVLFSLAYPLGLFMARVMEGRPPKRVLWLKPIETVIYKFCGIDPEVKYSAWSYFLQLFIFLLIILLTQYYLPLNPQKLPGLDLPLAFNTAISFMTNTNWQAYSGEVSLSYYSQMFGLTVQNFVSAATGGAIIMVMVIWGPSSLENAQYPRVYLRHLRQKLEDNPERPVLFQTESGVGYRFKTKD